MKKIAIGLVTYNHSEQELTNWLKSLELTAKYAKQHNQDIQLTLFWIDNGNPTKSFLKQPDCINLPSRGNIGYTAAINLLIQQAMATEQVDFFLSSNPDGMFHPFFLKEILQFADRFPKAIIEASQFPEEHPKQYDPKTYDTFWASGCACLYPIDILQKVGLMDEQFFLYCEDVDFSWRVRLHGFRVKHCPTALYGHYVLNRQNSKLTTKYIYNSGRYLGAKWGNVKFSKWCEQVLLDEGIYSSLNELPIIKIPSLTFSKLEIANVVDFENQFYFSRGRW